MVRTGSGNSRGNARGRGSGGAGARHGSLHRERWETLVENGLMIHDRRANPWLNRSYRSVNLRAVDSFKFKDAVIGVSLRRCNSVKNFATRRS